MNASRKSIRLPRLVNIALGLSVATTLAILIAPLFPEGITARSYVANGRSEFAMEMAMNLFLVTAFTWVLAVVVAVIKLLLRWGRKRRNGTAT